VPRMLCKRCGVAEFVPLAAAGYVWRCPNCQKSLSPSRFTARAERATRAWLAGMGERGAPRVAPGARADTTRQRPEASGA
jgi:hypothetical protein